MQRKLIIGFVVWFACMFIVAWATSSDKHVLSLDGFTFHTTDSDELYFTNVRSFFYTRHVDEASRFDIIRLKKWQTAANKPILAPTIIHDWRNSQAYIRFEGEEHFDDLEITYKDSIVKIPLGVETNESHLLIAMELFNGIEYEAKLVLHKSFKADTLAKDQRKRIELKTVLEDYFKLCGQLR